MKTEEFLENNKEEFNLLQEFKHHKYELNFINNYILKESRFTDNEIDNIVNNNEILINKKIIHTLIECNEKNINKLRTLNTLNHILKNIYDNIHKNIFQIPTNVNLKNQIELIPILKKYVLKYNYDINFYIQKDKILIMDYDDLTENQLLSLIALKEEDNKHIITSRWILERIVIFKL